MATPDKIRSANYRKRKREREAAAKTEAIGACSTRTQWYEKNRAELEPETLKTFQARHEQVLDVLHWMKHVHEDKPSDSDFVSMSDGLDVLLDDINKYGCPHLGYVLKNPDIPSDWSTGAWHDDKKYWNDAELVSQLCAEYRRRGATSDTAFWRGFRTGRWS